MKVTLCAVGKLKARSEERILTDDYLKRFSQAGRNLGWSFLTEHEVEDKTNSGMEQEAALLSKAVPTGDLIVTLDERGKLLTSPEFAAQMTNWADQGRNVSFVIGGADGIAPSLRAKADSSMSFGKMVWPHKLVRVMIAEQLYRAATIKGGSPYHRA